MTRTGNVYGQGLYALAKEERLEGEILQQLQVLEECFGKDPEYLKLLASSNVPKQERIAILDRTFAEKLHPYVLNFLKLLTEKGYIRHFSSCCQAFLENYRQDNGILAVQAISAVALSEEQKEKLVKKLEVITGKRIELLCKVDPKVLGGMRLSFDGKQVDGTVQGRLQAMEKQLKNTVI